MHTSIVYILRHVYKNDLNVLIELQPSPGLNQALSAKTRTKGLL